MRRYPAGLGYRVQHVTLVPMRHYYTADAIRAAEAPLLASLPDGVLMRRAAYGLATAIAAELRTRTGGAGRSPRVRGRRIG